MADEYGIAQTVQLLIQRFDKYAELQQSISAVGQRLETVVSTQLQILNFLGENMAINREKLEAILAKQANSDALLTEIADDIRDLKSGSDSATAENEALKAQVAELKQQIADSNNPELEALVDNISTGMDAHEATLQNIAAIHTKLEQQPIG